MNIKQIIDEKWNSRKRFPEAIKMAVESQGLMCKPDINVFDYNGQVWIQQTEILNPEFTIYRSIKIKDELIGDLMRFFDENDQILEFTKDQFNHLHKFEYSWKYMKYAMTKGKIWITCDDSVHEGTITNYKYKL